MYQNGIYDFQVANHSNYVDFDFYLQADDGLGHTYQFPDKMEIIWTCLSYSSDF